MYWGTSRENVLDARMDGKKTIWEYMVEKYGEEGAREKQRLSSETASRNAKGLFGTKKSEDHKKKIAESVKRYHQSKNK